MQPSAPDLMKGGLTNAGLRVAGTSFFNDSLAHILLGLACSAAHLIATIALLAAN